MAKRFLVTGGTGFIGAALVESLVRSGHEVRVLDNNFRGAERRLEPVKEAVEFVQADIRDPQAVAKACEGMDGVCHLAYVNGTERFYSEPELVLEVGVKGMLNVLDGCRAHGVEELLLMSSSEVYQTPPVVPTPETVPLVVPDPLEARYSYGGGKIISELLAINYGRKFFSRTLIVRPHNVFGPDMGFQHVIPEFVARLHQARKDKLEGASIAFPIQGTGQETRAFIYIDDFIDGLRLAMAEGKDLEIFHVGNPSEVSIAELAELVASSLGVEIEIQTGPLASGSTLRRCPDISKLSALGFVPKVSLAEGVRRYVHWFREKGVPANAEQSF